MKVTLALMAITLFATTPALADCRAQMSALADVLGRGSLDEGRRMLDDIDKTSLDCGPGDIRYGRRLLADAMLATAAKLRSDPMRKGNADHLVSEAASLEISWRASEELGDIEAASHDYAAAARDYHHAIERMMTDEDAKTIAAIPEAKRQYLLRRAEETRHLVATGSGQLIGLRDAFDLTATLANRGAEATRIPIPILFVYNSDEFTAKGVEVAGEVVAALMTAKSRTITIVGYTDRIGSAGFNLALSRRRASKVASYLRQNGITADMVTVGKGYSERALSQPNDYSQAEVDQLNRRVEFSLAPDAGQ